MQCNNCKAKAGGLRFGEYAGRADAAEALINCRNAQKCFIIDLVPEAGGACATGISVLDFESDKPKQQVNPCLCAPMWQQGASLDLETRKIRGAKVLPPVNPTLH